jgi:hypothetical protein
MNICTKKIRNAVLVYCTTCILLAGVPPGHAQLPLYTCKMTNENIRIDGLLNEQAWAHADTISFLENTRGVQPFQTTNAFAAWDSTNLYVAFVTLDSNIKGTLKQHDAVLYTEEAVEVFFDADGDGSTYIELEWNCLNTSWDGLSKPSGADLAWAPSKMQSAVRLLGTANDNAIDTGMTVEILIPWKALDVNMTNPVGMPPKNNDLHRINLYRIDQRTNVSTQDLSAWSPTLSPTFHVPVKFGTFQYSTAIITSVTPKSQNRPVPAHRYSLSTSVIGTCVHVTFQIPEPAAVSITINTIAGQKIRTIATGSHAAGVHNYIWNGRNADGAAVANGIYLISMQSGDFQQSGIAPIKR